MIVHIIIIVIIKVVSVHAIHMHIEKSLIGRKRVYLKRFWRIKPRR